MIKIGNVWYPKSQKKEAMEAAKNRRKAWITERRKRSLYGRSKTARAAKENK
jgi:hypothetical protein